MCLPDLRTAMVEDIEGLPHPIITIPECGAGSLLTAQLVSDHVAIRSNGMQSPVVARIVICISLSLVLQILNPTYLCWSYIISVAFFSFML